ncbi:hypothetical protein L873DRAFT_974177 [Choiromyces venosus 120613-1]|uniref:Mid2 domain-containing protein n=1 Tax=Choiromyces venosus 120613-1 TaxID=1336337 RepID=A0A3N4JLN6_9PEZI|nr:hypothetical protein L873DRAFT_974177 [Choiromyces venosus 120613-1]
MHQALFLLLPAFHLASGLAVPNDEYPSNVTSVTAAHHSEAVKAAENLVKENESNAPNHNIRMFLIIFGAIAGLMCLSIALFFTHALLSKKRRYGGGKKKSGRRMALSRLPRDRRGSTDSDIWGLTDNRQSLGTAAMREKDFGAWSEEVIPPSGHVYQEVPTEEAGRRYTSYTYHPAQYPGPNSRALEERYAPYEGRQNNRGSRGSVMSVDAHGKPVMTMNVI